MTGTTISETLDVRSPGNRFSRRPWRTMAVLLLVAFFCVELLLRLLPLPLLDFAFAARQVYRYHDRWYIDFRPGHAARLFLPDDGGAHVLDFEIVVDERGLRHADGDDVDAPDARVVHAIGDSFTMGWGVDGDQAYPARLDHLLGPRFDVLNLGINGFGAIGATGKSFARFDAAPPDLVIYLATENDYYDDETASRHQQRPAWLRRLLDVGDRFRRTFLVGSIPFAGRWALQLARLDGSPATDGSLPPTPVRVLDDEPLPPHRPDWGVASKRALRRYVENDLPEGCSMIVFTHGSGPVVKDLAAFSRSLGLNVVRLQFDPRLIIPRDGHLTARGNQHLAETIARELEGSGLVPGSTGPRDGSNLDALLP